MSVPATRARALVYAGAAVVLVSVTLLVSRLADFGVVPAEEFGAGDWKRGDVKLKIDVVTTDGIRHPLPSSPVLRPGDQLHLAYGKTRYTSLWVVRIGADRKVHPLVPAPGTPEALGKYGRRTENEGEKLDLTIEVPDEDGPLVLLGMFSAVPRRLDEIQAAADAVASDDPETIARTLYIPSRRFVHVIEIRRP